MNKVILNKLLLVICSLLLFLTTLQAFNYPSVSIYDPLKIGSGNQNWMIDQKQNGDIVIANEMGLLIFNGAQWQLYPFSALNAVHVVGDRIYSGGYRTMGFWQELPTGEYVYTSLVDKLPSALLIDEMFWNIFTLENEVIFQSLNRIIYYDELTGDFTIIPSENGVNKMFMARGKVYFQDYNRNLFYLDGKKVKLFYSSDQLPNSLILNLFTTDFGTILFTAKDGFHKLQTTGFSPWEIGDPGVLQTGDFFSALQLNDGSFALGSITQGLFLLDHRGYVKHHLDQRNSLSNNTVLHLFEDKSRNLWLGLDNGINVAHLNSPFEEYIDKDGKIGTVYCAALFQDNLYVGTNQGLFFKKYKSQDEFSIVQNTNGQVWSICLENGVLFCCHNLGTFVVQGNRAIKISEELGAWKMLQYPEREDMLIQGNYDGLHLFERKNGNWNYQKRLEPYRHSFRQFTFIGNYLYYYHSTLGLNRVKLSSTLSIEGERTKLYQSEIIEQTSLVSLGDHLLFSTYDGIFKVSSEMDSLQKVHFRIEGDKPPKDAVGKFNAISDSLVAFIQDNDLYLIDLYNDSINVRNVFFIDGEYFKSKLEYENISRLDSSTYLIGMNNGYLLVDIDKIDLLGEDYEIEINSISVNQSNQPSKQIPLDYNEGFTFQKNNFTFHFNIHDQVKYQSVAYQYKLEGDHINWSEWTDRASASYYKLRPGPYSFKVRARVGNKVSANIASYNFWIKNPWYKSLYALAAYLLLFIMGVLLVNYIYKTVYQKRQEQLLEKADKELKYIKLKSEQELMQEKNERLRTEIDSKNKELAVTASYPDHPKIIKHT